MMKLVVTTLVLAAACKHYDADKLAAVCDGTGYGAAATYDPGARVDQLPFAIVKKWVRAPTWTLDTPKPFADAGLVAPSRDNHERVSLALCIEQTAGAFDRDCAMDAMDATMQLGDGDPKVEVHKQPGAARVIKAYGAHYAVTLREAKTGKVLAQQTIEAKVEHCPIITLGDDLEDYAELPEDALIGFLAPHLPPALRTKLLATPAVPGL